MSDALANGRALRALTVLDDFTKEASAIEVDTSLSGLRVTRVLDRVVAERRKPDGLRLAGIQPGKPVENSDIQSFNGRFRDECRNTNWFENLADAQSKIESWRVEYNQ